jgi:hypothetical protein
MSVFMAVLRNYDVCFVGRENSFLRRTQRNLNLDMHLPVHPAMQVIPPTSDFFGMNTY